MSSSVIFALAFALLAAALGRQLVAARRKLADAAEQHRQLEETLAAQRASLEEAEQKLADQRREHLLATASLRQDVDEKALTEQMLERALDASEAAVRAKHEFLANMSHEIRTPLNGVLGMVEILLSKEPEPRERRQIVRAMQTSGHSLLRIIDDVLDLSKLEAGKVELERREVDLHELVEDVLESFGRQVYEKGLEISAHLAEAPRRIRADPVRLRQILVNLLGNAIKFTHRGEVTLGAFRRASDRIGFEVRDTGIGIPQDKAASLFDAFDQADTSTTRKYGGTGLGLTICRRLTDLMGGRLELRSVEGEGTVFEFEIRAFVLPDEPSPDEQLTLETLAGRRVVLVDPSEWAREARAALLSSLGLEVGMPGGIAELRSLVDSEPGPEALFVDLAAIEPRTWPEAEEAPSESEPPGPFVDFDWQSLYSELPIFLMAPSPRMHARDLALGLGLDGVVAKPLRRQRLLEVLNPSGQGAEAMSDDTGIRPPEPLAPSLPLRILIAEDNPVNQMVAEEILRLLGYQPEVADNGEAAVEKVLGARPGFDLVLMDMMMPQMDGLEATRRIRASLGTERQPWIVALTANVLEEQRQQCREAGMDGFLAKPMRLEATRELLEHVEPRGVDSASDLVGQETEGGPQSTAFREADPAGGIRP